MNNPELVLILVVLIAVAVPVGFIRYRLNKRSMKAQESIAKSLEKLAESQPKSQ